MEINILREGDGFAMLAQNEDGQSLHMDASPDIGGTNTGMRPMQLLLSAVGGCSTIDVLLILKKQRHNVGHFSVRVDGQRENLGDYSLFRQIVLHFNVQTDASREKVERAIQLSLDKYCSVAKTLEPTAQISHTLEITPL